MMAFLYNLIHSKSTWRTIRTRFAILLLLILIASITLSTYLTLLLFSSHKPDKNRDFVYRYTIQNTLSDAVIDEHLQSKSVCRFHTCFEINNCTVSSGDRIGVYVYPKIEFTLKETNEKISSFTSVEYQELIEAVKNSRYYQQNFSKACVFIPSFDTLSQDAMDIGKTSLILHALPQSVNFCL